MAAKVKYITDIAQLDLDGHYTYADYLTWRFEEMVELIKGKVFRMSPGPSVVHQQISGNLQGLMFEYFKTKACWLFTAPFDVRFPAKKEEETDNVVQPDICVICEQSKLDQQGCNGAPDWIIEILSPGNTKKEMKYKFDLYEEQGVKEYWLINPENKSLLMYTLNDHAKYIGSRPYTNEDKVSPGLFPNLELDLEQVFDTLEF